MHEAEDIVVYVLGDRDPSMGKDLLKLWRTNAGRAVPEVEHARGRVDAIFRGTVVGVPVVPGACEVFEWGTAIGQDVGLSDLDYVLLSAQLTLSMDEWMLWCIARQGGVKMSTVYG